MKPLHPHRALRALLLGGGLLFAAQSARAITYTFTPTTPAGTYAWTANGNWDVNEVPVSATDAVVTFFANTTTALANGTLAVNTDPATLTLNTLTLNGKGAAATATTTVNIGTTGNTWTFDGATPAIHLNAIFGSQELGITVKPRIVLNQNLMVTGNGNAGTKPGAPYFVNGHVFSGIISGGYSITKNGTSTLSLAGNNSYTGGTVIHAGTIHIGHANAFGSGTVAFAGNAKMIPSYGGNLIIPNSLMVNPGVTAEFTLINGNYKMTVSGPVTGSGTFYVNNSENSGGQATFSNAANTFTGTLKIGSVGNSNPSGTLTVNSLSDSANPIQFNATGTYGGAFQLGAGTATPLVFNRRQIQLVSAKAYPATINNANASATNTIIINTELAATATGAKTLALGGANAGANAFNGRIADGSGAVVSLTKAGAGRWIVSGANTYTGKTTVGQGILSVNTIKDYEVVSAIGAPVSGAIQLGDAANTGTLAYTGSGDFSNRTVQIGNATAANTGGGAINNSGSGALTFTAANFNPTLTGITATRTLTLGGAYTGGANRIQGIIQNHVAASGMVALIKADPSIWMLSGANTFTGATTLTGGGTLILDYSTQDNSKLSDTAALTLSGGTLKLTSGSHTEVVSATTLNTAGTFLTRSGGGTGKLRLNAITRAAGGTIDFADATIADTDTANLNGILGGWATLGTDWASNSTGAGDDPITALASYSALPQTDGADTDNDLLTGSQIQSGNVLANSLKIAGSGTADTLDLGANNLTITYASATNLGGILYTGGGDNNYTITGTGGLLTTSTTGELIVNAVTGTLTIATPLVTSGATAGILTKTGAGTLSADAANAYTGATYVNQGVLRLRNATASGSTGGGIAVRNGAALELDNHLSVGAEALNPLVGTGVANGGALRNISGSGDTTYGGAITIGSGGARINSDSGGTLILSGGVVTALFQNATFGGAGHVTVQTAALSGAGGLVKDGTGTASIASALNTYGGDTTVNAGTLQLNSANANNDGSTVTIAATGATLDLNYSGTDTVKRLIVGTATMADGVYTAGNTDQITGAGTLTVNSGGTVPKLSGTGITDDKTGSPVVQGTQVTYTVTFNVDMDASTVDVSDFGNAGTATFTIDAVTETTSSSGIFTVLVTPTSAGTLQLKLNAGAVLKDNAGSVLNTIAAIPDDTTLTVTASDITPPTLAGSAMVDDMSGGSITPGTPVTYTLTFSEAMNVSTVSAADFGNTGTAVISVGTVTEITPGVFTVTVTPLTGGTLQLRINAGAYLTDLADNPLDTSAAIADNTTIAVDGTAPTLAGTAMVDNQGGGPVEVNTLVTYTVTFSEDMDASTVDADDFGNAGTATFMIGTITETTPSSGIFTVKVTPTSVGTLQLQINDGVFLNDAVGNALDTHSALVDDTTLVIHPDISAPTPNPMGWASAPAAGGAGSIVMTATTATDGSGVEYSFECTSGGGHSSGWQNSATFTDSGLSQGTTYGYRVQARDMSPAQTMTGFSATAAATTAQLATFSSSATPPTVDGADVANLGAPLSNPDKWFFATKNESDPADWAKGQTFTTGAAEGLLKAVTYKTSAGNFKNATTTYTVRLGTLTGTTFNPLVLAAATQTVDTGAGDYMTWTFGTPIRLSPNTLYAIDVAMVSALDWSTGAGIPYLEFTGNAYAGGQFYQSGPTGGSGSGPSISVTAGNDRVFHLDIDHATTGYSNWTSGGFPSGKPLTDTHAAHDFDRGGLATGIEWVVGGDPTDASDDTGKAPTFDTTTDPGKFLFIFRRAKAAGEDATTSIAVAYGSDLGGWRNSIDNGVADGVTTRVVTDGFGTGIDKVTVAIPRSLASGGKLFARLKVVLTTP